MASESSSLPNFRQHALRVTRQQVTLALLPLVVLVLSLASYVMIEITTGQQHRIVSALERTIGSNIVDGDSFQLTSMVTSLVKSGIFAGVEVTAQGRAIAHAGSSIVKDYGSPVGFSKSGIDITHIFSFDQVSGASIAVSNHFSYFLILAAIVGIALIVSFMALVTSRVGTRLATELSAPLTNLAKSIAASDNVGVSPVPQGERFAEVHEVWYRHQDVVSKLKTFLANEAEAEKNKAIATATLNLAHDIKNPLISIDFGVLAKDWAEFSSLKPQMSRALETIREILGGLGNTSDLSALRIRVVNADFETVVSDLETIYGNNGTSVSYSGPEPFAAKIDLIAVERSIGNFVKNAAEAGASDIQVEALINDEALTLRVSDNGPGVPAPVLDKLFKRGATGGKAGGSGIGLHNVKNIAQAHGGSVSHRRKDRRTIFEMVLPNAVILESAPQEIIAAAAESKVTAPVVTARAILVKLPDVERQRSICSALKRSGLDVVTEDPGEARLALIYADFDSAPEDALRSKVRMVFDDEDYTVDVACKKISQIFASIVSPLTTEAPL